MHEFTDTEKEPASNFSVTANWGDGTSSPATVSGEGCYEVSAPSHTYATPATYSFTETVHDAKTGLEHTVGGEEFYVLSALPGHTTPSPLPVIDATVGVPWSGVVGEFGLNFWVPLSGDAATIDWGDGQSSPGTITAPVFGAFLVSGGHTYTHAMSSSIKVSVSAEIETGTWTTDELLVKTPPVVKPPLEFVRHPILAAIPSVGKTKVYELVFRVNQPLPAKSPGNIAASLSAFGHTLGSIASFGPHKSHDCYAAGVKPQARKKPRPGRGYPFSLSLSGETGAKASARMLTRDYSDFDSMLAATAKRLGC